MSVLGGAVSIPLDSYGAPASTDGSGFDVCAYDDDDLVAQFPLGAAGSCGGKPCWKAGSNSFSYSSKAGTSEGIQSLTLSAGEGTKIKLKGAGPNLVLPGSITQAVSLRVQLVRGAIG